MKQTLLLDAPGEKHLLLGNEAIVRGALEAGVHFFSCYPGTPSSEVPDTFFSLASSGRYRFEYSVNEKVALEVAGGAAIAGALSMVTMKHVGVNVAADPFFTLAYVGAPGGLLLLSADDPGCHSSQNEQDNRTYARFAGYPVFEPATAQECKDMTRDALLFARKTEQPVMLRTSTRVNHLRGSVRFDALPATAAEDIPFKNNPMRFVPVPAVSRARHNALLQKREEIRAEVEKSPYNISWGEGKVGIIASGIARAYMHDALYDGGWTDKVRVLELGFSWPLPEKRIEELMRNVDTLVILEELEPLLETEIRALAQKLGITLRIVGKMGEGAPLSLQGEYSTAIVRNALAPLFGAEPVALSLPASVTEEGKALSNRPPNLCPGCSHRAVYYMVRKIFGDDAIYSSDIGCYTLGMLPPLRAADFLLCMGSSVSAGSGFAAVSQKPVVGFIGDSTFFHSGITGLVNAVFNRHNVLLVVLDNRTTAMTGHQPNPGVDADLMGEDRTKVDMEGIIRACGVTQIARVKPFNVSATEKVLEEMKGKSGVRVIIAEEPCVLYARRKKMVKPQVAYVSEQSAAVAKCLKELACPAFRSDDGIISIDESLCSGCMVCLQLAPEIKARKRSA